MTEAPEEGSGGGDFDEGIEAEGDEGDGVGEESGGEGEDGFKDVIGDGEPLEALGGSAEGFAGVSGGESGHGGMLVTAR